MVLVAAAAAGGAGRRRDVAIRRSSVFVGVVCICRGASPLSRRALGEVMPAVENGLLAKVIEAVSDVIAGWRIHRCVIWKLSAE